MKDAKMRNRLGIDVTLGGFGLACIFLGTIPGHAEATAPALAIVALDYIDTSGEVRDQEADHARRLKFFMEQLRGDLAASGKFRIVTLDCPTAGCPTSSTPSDELVAAAGKAGAAYVLVGGIHKMSTLVQWARVQIHDASLQKVVFDRLLTFRGDDDASWRHAEEFLVRDILAETALKSGEP
jgi:Protein of unknown function (DUF2380)